MDPRPDPAAASALSCYTANLLEYLWRRCDNAHVALARSVRLAVRTDLPEGLLAFSHHARPLHHLPDGSRLAYRGAATAAAAVDGIAAELAAHGQVLIVTNRGRLPWGAPSGDREAPHFALIDSHRGRWHVIDRFAALLPEGPQETFAGWISTAVLRRALSFTMPVPAQQLLRNEYAFGFPVRLPDDGAFQWIVRVPPAEGEPAAELPGDWVLGSPAALDYLRGYLVARAGDGAAEVFLDDLWAAARHHAFRHRLGIAGTGARADAAQACADAAQAWTALPMTLRFAYDSARRGRPRASLIGAAFDKLRLIEGGELS